MNIFIRDKGNALNSDENMKEFECILNGALPLKEDIDSCVVYRLLHNLTNNRHKDGVIDLNRDSKTHNYLKGSHECLILWCRPKTISSWFNIQNQVFIKWDQSNRSYKLIKNNRVRNSNDVNNRERFRQNPYEEQYTYRNQTVPYYDRSRNRNRSFGKGYGRGYGRGNRGQLRYRRISKNNESEYSGWNRDPQPQVYSHTVSVLKRMPLDGTLIPLPDTGDLDSTIFDELPEEQPSQFIQSLVNLAEEEPQTLTSGETVVDSTFKQKILPESEKNIKPIVKQLKPISESGDIKSESEDIESESEDIESEDATINDEEEPLSVVDSLED